MMFLVESNGVPPSKSESLLPKCQLGLKGFTVLVTNNNKQYVGHGNSHHRQLDCFATAYIKAKDNKTMKYPHYCSPWKGNPPLLANRQKCKKFPHVMTLSGFVPRILLTDLIFVGGHIMNMISMCILLKHSNDSIICIRQKEVETVWGLFTAHGKKLLLLHIWRMAPKSTKRGLYKIERFMNIFF